jgi:RNA polymerase sigma factor (TIGR02999 family)
MRNILVERIRRKSTLKREVSRRVELPEEVAVLDDGGVAHQEDVLAVGEALERFEREHPRPAEVVWLRFFGGLSMPEVAEVLSISLASAERDWRFARAWLQTELASGEA